MPRTVPTWRGKNDDTMPPPSVTLRIFERAKGCCQHCLRKLMAGEKWHRDHIKPLADGGQNIESNFQVLCDPCHGVKTVAENVERAKVRAKTIAAFNMKAPPKQRIKSAGFPKRPRPSPKPIPPRAKPLYAERE